MSEIFAGNMPGEIETLFISMPGNGREWVADVRAMIPVKGVRVFREPETLLLAYSEILDLSAQSGTGSDVSSFIRVNPPSLERASGSFGTLRGDQGCGMDRIVCHQGEHVLFAVVISIPALKPIPFSETVRTSALPVGTRVDFTRT